MEHVLTCYETIPYWFADPVSGDQAILSTPDGSLTYECANAGLDDVAQILVNGVATSRLTSAVPGEQMEANDKTDMLNNVALSSDYSVQLKDDGKPLYGWGGVHKRPNDIRMYAQLALPKEWKVEGANYKVTKAQLVVNHWITNNPNDQLRPEDLENEAATGRKPSYRVENTPEGEVWKSTVDCYEGDGDFIDSETPATPIGDGTVLKNMPFALSKDATPGPQPEEDPYAFSSDLTGALTNAYYTTINRDPFEWSYVKSEDKAEGVYDFVGSSTPLSDEEMAERGLELVSGPRWRLKPNKFGQDLPGLEIPLIECSPPPFKSDNIKYEVGTPVTTVINLLDWADENSPLATSKGWVDYTANEFIEVTDGLSGNGLPITQDFDLAVYIKGDAKSTALYNAQLIIEYEDEGPQPPGDAIYDLALTLSVPPEITAGSTGVVSAVIFNSGPDAAEGATVTVTGITNRGTEVISEVRSLDELASSGTANESFNFDAPTDRSTKINWTVMVSSAGDTNPVNNDATAKTKVRK
jgi:hypothetical protein